MSGVREVWVLFSFRIPPDMKVIVENMSSRAKVSQSELVRRAVNEYIVNHSSDEWERKAAEIVAGKQDRQIKLVGPKDDYDVGMQVVSAWETICNQKKQYEWMGILRRSVYERWLNRLEGNIVSVNGDDPEGAVAIESFELLIEKLREEMDSLFPKNDAVVSAASSLDISSNSVV